MPKTASPTVMLTVVLLAALSGSNLQGATQVQVNANGRSCLSTPVKVYTTIQAAVSVVSPGGIVFVCPGTYPEQVTITQALTLRGVASGNSGAAVITSPATGLQKLSGTSTAPQVFVFDIPTGAVTIDNLTIDAANNKISTCERLFEGVYFYNASGTVKNVVTRNQTVSVDGHDCNTGFGIRVVGETSNATVTVQNNSVHDYDLVGILAQSSLARVTIRNNSISGPGTIRNVATQGIWMLDGATGTISGNSVVNNSGSAAGGSQGILVQGSHGVTISNNMLGGNAYGIVFKPDSPFDSDDSIVTQNTILGSGIDGVYACSNSNVIQGNTISASHESGVNLPSVSGSCSGNNNTVSNNTINDACAGILADTSVTGNVLTANSIFNAINLQLIGSSCP